MIERHPATESMTEHVPDHAWHPSLSALLAELTFTESGLPDHESWWHLLTRFDRYLDQNELLALELSENMAGRSSYENLFRLSPFTLIEQDYTRMAAWMADLQARGVDDIHDYLGGDIEKIRSIVPLIEITAANPAAVRFVGLSMDQLIGPVDPSIVNEGSEDGWLAQIEAVWERRPETRASFRAATTDGHEYLAESILTAPLIDGEPDFSRAVFSIVDVTLQHRERLQMKETMEAKNKFLASVSHEIRTPLTAILGFSKLLDDDESLDAEDQRLMISSIVQHAQEVTDLVDDLLVAARADIGEVNVMDIEIDLVQQVRETIAAGGSFTSDVELETTTPRLTARGDPARVRQVMRNLLTNAERYGGPDVRVTLTERPGMACVEVSDDGPGLPIGEWERIFEPYQRGHLDPGQPESVGIGLAISRQLAELMGGTLSYERRDGRSVFMLYLRRSASSEPGSSGD